MRLEDMKHDFPSMPEEIREMIEREVDRQVKTERPEFQRRGRAAGRTIAASVAAVMILGTTVFAGARAYRVSRNSVGEHGVEVKITNETGEDTAQKALEIPNVRMEVGYLPDGMVQKEEGKYSYEDALAKGGVSLLLYKMDTGDEKFSVRHEDVQSSEDVTINGYEGVYLESPSLSEDDISFNQRLYVAYTDVHYVLEMYIASDVAKEEAVKIAEGIRLTAADDGENEGIVSAWNWSDYQKGLEESRQQEAEDFDKSYAVAKEEMENTHAVGEGFLVEKESGLFAKITDVQVADDLSLLDPARTDEEMKGETDENGKLLPADIQYVRKGSADVLSEAVSSRQVPQKLVYVTAEYTNTGTEELSDVLFFGSLLRICEQDGQMRMPSGDGYLFEKPQDGDAWTDAVNRGMSAFWEMQYYDAHGGERGNNYMDRLQPGETKTVHMAWIVTEEELEFLHVSLNPSGGLEFSESSLETGYVDIRQ